MHSFSSLFISQVSPRASQLISLRLIDTVGGGVGDINPIISTIDYAKDSFFGGLSSRLVGFLFGNILAGIVFKYIVDAITSRFAEAEPVKPIQKIRNESDPPGPSISGEAWIKLLFCLALDLGGDLSFTLPGVGEVEDIAWAPISAFLLKNILGSSSIAALDFVKEALPGTDILPVATIAWVLQNVYPNSFFTKAVGLNKDNLIQKDKKNDTER